MLVSSKDQTKTTKELIDASIGALIDALEAGHSEALTAYLSAMANFHYYSFGNILLIAAQKPGATRVAGIWAWNKLGRRIRRGEKGIMILAPMVGKKRRKSVETEEAENDSQTSDARSKREGKQPNSDSQLIGFRGVYVWDVSQTEGAELPNFAEVTGNPDEQLPRLIKFVKAQSIKLDYSDKIAPARGMSYGGAIRLVPNMAPAEEFSILVHELAHEMIHKSERRTTITKTVKETEAEAIAFVVSRAIGLETGSASADYIQLYHGNAELLRESLEIVQRTAAIILGAIAPEPKLEADSGASEAAPAAQEAVHPNWKALESVSLTDSRLTSSQLRGVPRAEMRL